ncbi:MAG TPA: accessory factor UbiK family protein [Rhodanobacteraceae bacterium]|nr:accessory factor UbiK family protein [Rhodanobacteraceae bacterium]
MLDVHTIDQLADRLGNLIPPGFGQARADIQANMRDVLMRGLRGLDLVTREEFDVQAELLERARKRLEALEWRVAALESKPHAND